MFPLNEPRADAADPVCVLEVARFHGVVEMRRVAHAEDDGAAAGPIETVEHPRDGDDSDGAIELIADETEGFEQILEERPPAPHVFVGRVSSSRREEDLNLNKYIRRRPWV